MELALGPGRVTTRPAAGLRRRLGLRRRPGGLTLQLQVEPAAGPGKPLDADVDLCARLRPVALVLRETIDAHQALGMVLAAGVGHGYEDPGAPTVPDDAAEDLR
eukprot:CAMPEP_0171228168 /NCGR_PEP_ID=MMETSP0790-20130122/38226_1 /TAXON_ID=2925 /ORGANISM="Alexandrium catenella, Strain OF101" /LENGTH=103 /DNA_ID=CAMNT_0011694309 /DNA_START=1 /DNA_END=309 /DNA_ORIENTATION=-